MLVYGICMPNGTGLAMSLAGTTLYIQFYIFHCINGIQYYKTIMHSPPA